MNGVLHHIVGSDRWGISGYWRFSLALSLFAVWGFGVGPVNAAETDVAATSAYETKLGTIDSVRGAGEHGFGRHRYGEAMIATRAMCPFCTALKPTLAEEMEATDAVVFAKVLGPGQMTEDGFDRKLRLQVSRILKGKSFVAETDEFETIAPASLEQGQECLVMGVLTDRMTWSTPMKLTDRSRDYILAVQTLPAEGPDRVKFFLNYLEDSESFMAFDAYDEFARAPYEAVKAIKGDMNRENLLKWVQDPEVSINRKRLYFTLIGVCGLPEDLPLLERLIQSPEKRDRAALDSLIACYLTLSGVDGVKLIEDRFLRDASAEYVDTYAAVAALRFHGTESDVIPVPRIVEAVRWLLDRPEVADLVIADLARWKDWSVTDRLVEMFKNANEKTQWVRVPIVHFLRVNPDPSAKAKIEELRAVDPQSVRRALAFFELEAAMQTEADAEDAEFERQLKELETEKSKEKQDGKGPAKPPGQGPGNSPSAGASDNLIPSQTAENGLVETLATPVANQDNVASEGTRLTAFRPILDDSANAEDSAVELSSLSLVETDLDSAAVRAPVAIPANEPPAPIDGAADSRTAANAPTLPINGNGTKNREELRPEVEGSNYLVWIVGVPVMVNGLLLVLAWSILNGTFSRLFC